MGTSIIKSSAVSGSVLRTSQTNYKLIDSILLELSRKLKVQELQKVLADAWKPYMKNLYTVYTDASCYESLMRFPTDGSYSGNVLKGHTR